ncbi:MAG: DUF1405 domain-containing protein [Bacillota bacterium]
MKALRGLWNWFWSIPADRRWLWPLIAINFAGSLFGFYWYRDQLATTPWYTWIIVADSPLSSFYFTFVLLNLQRRVRAGWLEAVAYVGLIKYGFWTFMVISLYWLEGGPVIIMEALLVLSHLAMLVEGLMYFRYFTPATGWLVAATAWFAFDDYLDYFHGYVPSIPVGAHLRLVVAVSLASTYVVLAILLLMRRFALAREETR